MPNNPEESEYKLADDTTVTGSMPKNTYIQTIVSFQCMYLGAYVQRTIALVIYKHFLLSIIYFR